MSQVRSETLKERKILANLYPVEYEHPFDRESLNRLENTRGIDLLTQKVLDHGLEKYLLIKHTGDNIRIDSNNIPEVHALLLEACRILDMHEIPELYIQLEDKITSFTSGEKRRIIVLSSGAIDLLNEDELLFLLGRELGHIKSNHVLFRMMAESLQVVSQIISDVTLGIGNLVSMPLKIALMHWFRMSEFTADRAGLLTCQDPEVAAQALIKIAGLPIKYHGRITSDQLRKQAHDFDDIQETTFDKLIRFAASYENSQPFTIIRASQLFKWLDAGSYQMIMERQSPKIKIKGGICPNCQTPFTSDENYCRQCGNRLSTVPAPSEN